MTPVKPFDSYTWRWLTVDPSEGLLKAPVFLGVLRVLSRHEGDSFKSAAVFEDLSATQIELKEVLKSRSKPLRLARDQERNVVRNSGQYWRGTGLLTADRGIVHLTNLGRSVSSGIVTQSEFAALMVQQTVLPNPATYSPEEIAKWQGVGLQIRPLKLILEIIEELGRQHGGMEAAWLNNEELTGIVIPLAGAKENVQTIVRHLARYRRGKLDIADWPNCIPGANDDRMTREFLLFLASFGLLRMDKSERRNLKQRFYLDELFDVDAATPPINASVFTDDAGADQAIQDVRHSPLPSIIERQRVLASILARPGQQLFRSNVMAAYQNRCFVTGDTAPQVLEAAHIVPVKHGGADNTNNSFCLRADIHRLLTQAIFASVLTAAWPCSMRRRPARAMPRFRSKKWYFRHSSIRPMWHGAIGTFRASCF